MIELQRGGLVPHESNGPWGNRSKGNEGESLLDKGLSFLYNIDDNIEDGLAWVGAKLTGQNTDDALFDSRAKRNAGSGGMWIDVKGNEHMNPIIGIAPQIGIGKVGSTKKLVGRPKIWASKTSSKALPWEKELFPIGVKVGEEAFYKGLTTSYKNLESLGRKAAEELRTIGEIDYSTYCALEKATSIYQKNVRNLKIRRGEPVEPITEVLSPEEELSETFNSLGLKGILGGQRVPRLYKPENTKLPKKGISSANDLELVEQLKDLRKSDRKVFKNKGWIK